LFLSLLIFREEIIYMKSIVTSLGTIVFVAAVVAGGTGAFFSDTETSTGNRFTAGAIDLKVDSVAHVNGLVCHAGTWHPEGIVVWDAVDQMNELNTDAAGVLAAVTAYNAANPSNVPQAGEVCKGTWGLTDLEGEVAYTFFDYGDLKPGDNGENTISLHVFNNDAYMCATVDTVADNDNSQTEPEGDAETDLNPMAEGELDSELEFVIWEDDGDNILEKDEEVLVQTDNAEGIDGSYDLYTALNGALPAEEVAYLGVYWCYGDITGVETNSLSCDGSDVGNISQTDSLAADIAFYVEQARHNEDFTCEERDPLPNPVITQ
jgi:predicted ribosomally synthesized peptide with SipW-like signal peptide